MDGKMDAVIDGGQVRREGYAYCTLSDSGGCLYKKDGAGVRAYLGGWVHQRGRVSLLQDLRL
jgi:hypothetical protein